MQYFQALYRNYPFTRITQEDCFTVYQMAGTDGEGCGEMRLSLIHICKTKGSP